MQSHHSHLLSDCEAVKFVGGVGDTTAFDFAQRVYTGEKLVHDKHEVHTRRKVATQESLLSAITVKHGSAKRGGDSAKLELSQSRVLRK